MGLFRKRKDCVKSEEKPSINYTALFASMGKGQQLFNELKVRCHPDCFIGTDKQVLAEDLFKQVQANSTNYEKLLSLKEQIDNELYGHN